MTESAAVAPRTPVVGMAESYPTPVRRSRLFGPAPAGGAAAASGSSVSGMSPGRRPHGSGPAGGRKRDRIILEGRHGRGGDRMGGVPPSRTNRRLLPEPAADVRGNALAGGRVPVPA